MGTIGGADGGLFSSRTILRSRKNDGEGSASRGRDPAAWLQGRRACGDADWEATWMESSVGRDADVKQRRPRRRAPGGADWEGNCGDPRRWP